MANYLIQEIEQLQKQVRYLSPYQSHYERDEADDWSDDETEEDGEDAYIDTVVRLGGKGVWHGVHFNNSNKTFCDKPIAVTDLTKTRHDEKICRRCFRLWEVGSAKTGVNDRLEGMDSSQTHTLKYFNVYDLDLGYVRRVVQEFIGKGELHICAVTRQRNANLYRKGSRANCPDPKYHGR